MSLGLVQNCVKYRNNRIRSIRLKLIIHTRRAEYNVNLKGETHHDTVHEWGIVEELSARLSKELLLLETELEAYEEKKQNSWDYVMMEKCYD